MPPNQTTAEHWHQYVYLEGKVKETISLERITTIKISGLQSPKNTNLPQRSTNWRPHLPDMEFLKGLSLMMRHSHPQRNFHILPKHEILNTSRSVHITTEPSPLQGVSGENLKEWNSKTHWLIVRLMIKAHASDYLEQRMHCGQLPIPFPGYYSLSISPQHYCLCKECEGVWHWVYPSHKYCKMK